MKTPWGEVVIPKREGTNELSISKRRMNRNLDLGRRQKQNKQKGERNLSGEKREGPPISAKR